MNDSHDPVVSAEEMARVEKLAIQQGCNEEDFIREAGKKVALVALEWIEKKKLPKRVTLLAGKGNNGADAYAAGIYLLAKGVEIRALCLDEKGGSYNEKFKKLFLAKGGRAEIFLEHQELLFDELILDGFLGIGFKGNIEGAMASAIRQANDCGHFIIAIDVPSGLHATSGAVSSPCIAAHQTVALGLAKIGCFLHPGWQMVGQLRVESFGLPDFYLKEAHSAAQLLNKKQLKLPKIIRDRHKYEAGYVIGLSGSDVFKGAPKLAGLAALRSGAGIVRIFHWDEIGPAPMELICEKWDEKKWSAELKKARALFLGPGLGGHLLSMDLGKINVPMVIDADFLQPGISFPGGSILTPHRGEMLRLLKLEKAPPQEHFLTLCQKFAEDKGVILILKGAPTFIFHADHLPCIVDRGDPGMATAGTGDVLTGLLVALLAQKMSCYEAALLGVYLHALAGEEAAKEMGSYGMIASDLIAYLPRAFQEVCRLNQSTKRKIPSSKETVDR